MPTPVRLSNGGAAGYGVPVKKLLAVAGFRRTPAPARSDARPRESAPNPRATSRSNATRGDPQDDEPSPLAPPRRVTDHKTGRRVCEVCGRSFESRRIDARICSNRCRQQAFRNRRAQEQQRLKAATIEPTVFLQAAEWDPLLALDLAIRLPEIRRACEVAA